MSQPSSSANATALILLRIGFIICALLTTIFLSLTQLHDTSLGKPITFIIAAIGLYFLAGAMRTLFRELNRSHSTPKHSHLSPHH